MPGPPSATPDDPSAQLDAPSIFLDRPSWRARHAELFSRPAEKLSRPLQLISSTVEHAARPPHKSSPLNAVHPPDEPQKVRDEIAGMVAKVGAILAEIRKSWNYAHGTTKRMLKVHHVEWLRADQLHKLVAALSYQQKLERKS